MNDGEFQAHTEQIDRMVQRVTALTDDGARTAALELLQSSMDLHGAALSRIVEVLSESESGRSSLTKIGTDPLVCGLMVLYGVHPVALEERVKKALDKAKPQLQKKSASVELIAITDSMVRVNIQSSGHGCGSSPDAIKGIVEQALLEAAPEIAEIIADGVPTSTSGFVPISSIQSATREEMNHEESAA